MDYLSMGFFYETFGHENFEISKKHDVTGIRAVLTIACR